MHAKAATTEGELDEPIMFMRELWALDHALAARSKRMAARFGVTGPQRLVVRIVGARPGISAGEVAELLHVHPSTVTGVIRRLEQSGVLARRAAQEDRRRAVLTLTEKGKKLDGLRMGTVEASVRSALAKAPPEELAAARTLLARITAALERDDDTP
jgi:DNA-binding MarR family transcriptional regulator